MTHADQQLLETIFHKLISLTLPRLQVMPLRLRTHDIKVKYVGTKSVLIANTIKKLLRPQTDPEIKGLRMTIAQVLNIKQKLDILRDETTADSILLYCRCPYSMQDIDPSLHPYWCFRDNVTILDGLVLS